MLFKVKLSLYKVADVMMCQNSCVNTEIFVLKENLCLLLCMIYGIGGT